MESTEGENGGITRKHAQKWRFAVFRVTPRLNLCPLKTQTRSDARRSADGAKAVFVIFVIEKILDCAENAQSQFFAAQRESVTDR
jgi:hypothetical protein